HEKAARTSPPLAAASSRITAESRAREQSTSLRARCSNASQPSRDSHEATTTPSRSAVRGTTGAIPISAGVSTGGAERPRYSAQPEPPQPRARASPASAARNCKRLQLTSADPQNRRIPWRDKAPRQGNVEAWSWMTDERSRQPSLPASPAAPATASSPAAPASPPSAPAAPPAPPASPGSPAPPPAPPASPGSPALPPAPPP